MKGSVLYWAMLSACLLLFSALAHADDYQITLKNHQFAPNELIVPAGRRIKLTVKNLDPTPAEFESSDLDREKVVTGNSEISVFIGPLDPGRYAYFDDFHRNTTKGAIVAK